VWQLFVGVIGGVNESKGRFRASLLSLQKC